MLGEAGGLSTPRLLLPPLGPQHRDNLASLYSDPDVARHVGGDRLTPDVIDHQVDIFSAEWSVRGWGQSAVVERATGAFVGRMGLYYWSEWDEVELGYILAKVAQGRGLAEEGCRAWINRAREAGLSSLIASIHPENTASIRLAKKLGFGLERDDVTPSGFPTLVFRLVLAPAPDDSMSDQRTL